MPFPRCAPLLHEGGLVIQHVPIEIEVALLGSVDWPAMHPAEGGWRAKPRLQRATG